MTVVIDRKGLLAMLRERQKGRPLREWAAEINVSHAYLADVLKGNREPGPSILIYLHAKKQKAQPTYHVPEAR